MKLGAPFAMLALAGCAVAVAVMCLRDDDAQFQRAEAKKESSPAAPIDPEPAGGAAASVAVVERAEVPADVIEEVPKENPAPTVPAATRPTVASQARALIDAGLSEEVVNGMVKAVEDMESGNLLLVQQNNETEHRYACEYLLEIWPDLAAMIRRKELELKVNEFPPHNWSQPKVGVAIVATVNKEEKLSYSINMARWYVTFEFTGAANPKPELFRKIFAAGRAQK